MIEVVEWIDSAGTYRVWTPHSELIELGPFKFRSVGKLVRDTDEFIILAGSWDIGDDEGPLSGIITIPKVAILSQRTLSLGLDEKPG